MRKFTQRQRIILEALLNCRRPATTKEIALKTKLNVNGVSQTLGALEGECVDIVLRGKNHDMYCWKLTSRKLPPISKALWTRLNARRLELIEKRIDKTISPEEDLELNDLQQTAGRVREAAMSLKPLIRRLARQQKKYAS